MLINPVKKVPLFYNEPPSPVNVEEGVNGDAMDEGNEQMGNEQQGDGAQGNNDQMGDDISQSIEEWPSLGWDSYEEGSDGESVQHVGSEEDHNGGNNEQIITISDHDSMPVEDAPWELLAASVVGEYKGNEETVSHSGMINATVGPGDFWRRVILMPRFKRRGVQRRQFKSSRENVGTGEGLAGEKRKRNVYSDPGQGDLGDETQLSDASTTSACKRFFLEGREWLAEFNYGEDTNKQGTKHKGKVLLYVKYADVNKVYIEEMVDRDDDLESNNEIKKETGENSGNRGVHDSARQKFKEGTLDDEVGNNSDIQEASASFDSFAGVGRDQPSHSP